MTVDLSTARVGSEVTTHAGAKLVIERCEPNEWGIKFWFSGYTGWFIYQPDGAMSHAPRPNPMDIIAISPPPMSDAERTPPLTRKVIQWNTMETAKWCAADGVRLDDETMIEGARRQRRFTIDRLIKLQNEMMDEKVTK